MKKILETIINLIFPPKCIFCGEILDSSSKKNICSPCYSKIPFVQEGIQRLSTESQYKDMRLELIYLCEYTGIIRESLIRFKFFNKPSYYRVFAQMLGEKIKKMTNSRNFDIIISVPLHPSKERDRGYNQAQLLAKALGSETNIFADSTLLKKIKNTKSQSLLVKSERLINIKDAFKVNRPKAIQDKRILLIDDIVTTGSTLCECSKVLLEAGAKEVVCVVIASGRKY